MFDIIPMIDYLFVVWNRTLDRRSSNIYDEEFGMFYGEFELGKKDGYGIEINVRKMNCFW